MPARRSGYDLAMKYLASLFVVVWFALPVMAEEVSVGFYNVKNLFDVYDDPYTDDQNTDVKPLRDVRLLAEAIRELDADILGLCEVENEPIVQAMVDRMLTGMGYEYVAVPPTNDGRGIKLGLISRYPIERVISYRWQQIQDHPEPRSSRFARDLMHVEVDVPGDRPLHVFIVHFKSKGSRPGDPQSTKWRTAEAVHARGIVAKLLEDDPDALIAFIGDLNSNPDDPATSSLLEPVNGKPVLIDTLAEIPMPERITYPSTRYPNSVLDYILSSPALQDRLVPGSPYVMQPAPMTKGSDHQPIRATYNLGD